MFFCGRSILFCPKSPVDIMVGVTDEQAAEMAKNLEFKGTAQLEVRMYMYMYIHTHACRYIQVYMSCSC